MALSIDGLRTYAEARYLTVTDSVLDRLRWVAHYDAEELDMWSLVRMVAGEHSHEIDISEPDDLVTLHVGDERLRIAFDVLDDVHGVSWTRYDTDEDGYAREYSTDGASGDLRHVDAAIEIMRWMIMVGIAL
jgi:hypothetical protein